MNREEQPDVGVVADLVEGGSRLARLAAGTAWRVGSWALSSTVAAYARVGRVLIGDESMRALVRDTTEVVRTTTRETLGLEEGAFGPVSAGLDAVVPDDPDDRATPSPEQLRKRGRQLLQRSADVTYDERVHPAYERILDELAPDEARILRLLYLEGPQASVDVRGADSLVSDHELIAPGLTMIGAHAGARYVDRVHAYLNNLYRLGMIWFSREPVDDHSAYQVLEAQPEVLHALNEAKRTKTVRRSIHLTPFGQDFCEVCLGIEGPPKAQAPQP